MIVPIEINTDDITSQFDVSQSQIETMMDSVTKSLAVIYVSKLESLAFNELKSTRSRYIENIKLIDSGKLEATVLLDYSKDKLVRSIEEGAAAYDMKPGILAGPNAKINKKGKRYNSIPLGHKADSLPKPIYDLARRSSKPLAQSDLPSGLSTIGKRESIQDNEGSILFNEYAHKSSVYSGLHKSTDRVTGQSTYMSFRRVSDSSDPASFIHPGFESKHLMEKALQSMDIGTEVGVLIDQELSKLGF